MTSKEKQAPEVQFRLSGAREGPREHFVLRCRSLDPVITAPYRPSASLVPKLAAAVFLQAVSHTRIRAAVFLLVACGPCACTREYTAVAVLNVLRYVTAWTAK